MFDVLKSVGKHFAVYGVGRILGKLAAFILLPLYTHYLTTDEYGTLELLELTTFIVGMFVAGGIGHAVMRFYYDSEDPRERKRVVSTALLSIWSLCLVFVTVLMFLSENVSILVFETGDNAGLFRLIFLGMMLSLTNEIPLSFIRAQQKSTLFTIVSVTQLTVGLCLNILFIVGFGWGIRGIIISSITAQGVVGIFLAFYTFRYSGFGYSVRRAKELLRYGVPLIPAGLGYFLLNFADRYLLQRFTDLSQVGIYALGYKFGMMISQMVTEPFLSIFRPKIFEMAQTDREGSKDFVALILTYLVFVQLFMGLGISVLIKDALRIISDPAYHEAYKVVGLICLAYVIVGSYSVVQVGILLAKKTRYIAIMVGITAATGVGLNFLLIPRFGVWGAAFALLSAYTLLFTMNFVLSRRVYRVTFEYGRLIKLLLTAIAIYAVSLTIDIESVYIALVVKFLLACTYPAVLFVIGFYSRKERDKIGEIRTQVVNAVKVRFGGAA